MTSLSRFVGARPAGKQSGPGGRPGRVRRKWDGPAGHTCRSSGKQSGPAAGMVRARFPANPLFSVSGREPRAENFGLGGPPAGFFKARFAPRSPLTLAVPFRGANSSHKFRAAAQCRPAFPRRGLLPPPREPLKFRPGEQILHTNSAPTPESARLFQGAVCSPLPSNPCGSVPGSKFFTQIPHRRTKSTLPVYRQGASLSSTVPPQVPVPRGTFN